MTKTARASVVKSDPLISTTPAVRYQIERAWRQIRNGGTAATASSQDGQLDVTLGLVGGDRVKPRGQLAKHEESDRGRDSDICDEPT